MSAIALLLLLVVLSLLRAVYKGTHLGAEEVSIQQTSALLMTQLTDVLARSAPGQFHLEPDLLAARALETTSAEGDQVWSKELTIFLYQPDSNIVRSVDYSLQPDEILKTGFEVNSTKLRELAEEGRILAAGVTTFELSEGPPLEIRTTIRSKSGERSVELNRELHQALKMR